MKAQKFNENYSIDRTAKGIRAVEKTAGLKRRKPEIFLTRNGQVYNPKREYFFYDSQPLDISKREVRSSRGLKADNGFLASFGLRVVAIDKLRAKRDSALLDAQRSIRRDIKSLQDLITKLELQKTPENRNLKDFLIAKDAAES